MNDIAIIPVSSLGGSVSVTVTVPKFPQAVGGVIWRYKSDQTPDLKAGMFTTKASEVPLGAPNVVDNKFFLIEGAVLNHGDKPPTPYQVVVSVTQNGNILHTEVPSVNGSGKIGTEDEPFLYRFQLKSA